MATKYWLVKQEPEAYSWADFVQEKKTDWTGIRNYQARNNLREMKKGDVVFFYHSVSEKQIVGVASVSKEHFADPTAKEGDWSCVELKSVKPLNNPVTLEQMKADKALEEMPLIRHTRLSVMPLTAAHARRLLKLGGASL